MRRVTIAVPSLAEAVQRLDERSVAYERLTGILFTDRRLQVLDPAGNRVEFKQEWGLGPF
jgi:catechol 2,3-dioxygenase-like lactoylglutathione lyase family enzyme